MIFFLYANYSLSKRTQEIKNKLVLRNIVPAKVYWLIIE